MALPPGTRLGSYEITGAIGAGGMGEVYRATDTKLDRAVAIKVLPESFALDADRVARFTREAKTLAALNHPNIAQVFGVEEQGDTRALVMELVEGEDLSQLIARGPIAFPDALPIATQIADALEAAHEQGIIHRDLKPANIKVRTDGTVKVLDFGLAKALAPDGPESASQAMNSPTLTARATQLGVILGTAAYMAPEQARGRPVDRRADIWAFGVVLYEMLTGRRAFDGEDISITLASVLKEDVDWSRLPPDLPASWHRLLRRCLERDPRRRLSAIADARLELAETAESAIARAADDPEAASANARTLARLVRQARVSRIAAAIAGIAAVAALAALSWPRRADSPPLRVAFNWSVTTAQFVYPAVSPDGRSIAYVAPQDSAGTSVIWIRSLADETARILPGTDVPGSLAWSPDSRSIAFESAGRIARVDIAGGVQRLGRVSNVAGITWLPDGDLLVASNSGGPAALYRVPAQGAEPTLVTMPKQEGPAGSYVAPRMLPDGRHFLYLGWTGVAEERALFVGSLDGAPPARLVASEGVGAWANGLLFFVRDRGLYAQPFEPDSLRLSGEPTRIVDNLAVNALTGSAGYGVSGDVLAYRQGLTGLASDLAWFDRTGRELGTVGDGGNIFQIRLSHDGRQVAVVDAAGSSFRMSVLELGNGISSRLTDEATLANDPAWSPDSRSVAYEAVHSGTRQFFTQAVGGSDPKLVFESTDNPKWLDDWSADGQWLLFHRPRPSKLYAVKPNDPSSLRLLLDTTETIDGAHFSPDGKWVAYQITENGVYNVWVASFPAFDQRRQVSRQGGGQAMWRGDGRELFFLTRQGKMMAAAVTVLPSGGLDLAAPVELFQTPLQAPSMGIDQYSVSSDGRRFLLIKPRTAGSSTQTIGVIVNWKTNVAIGR